MAKEEAEDLGRRRPFKQERGTEHHRVGGGLLDINRGS